MATLVTLRGHYSARLENLPRNRHDKSYGEKLQAMAELDLDGLLIIVPVTLP